MPEMTTLRKMLADSESIVFFGGAGVSTESGIPDFRSVDGLYHTSFSDPPETILSRTYFDRHTETFYAFYRAKMLFPEAKPNQAHITLAHWEKQGRLKAVVTQNIDGLHQMAGSVNVMELHGSVYRNTCMHCRAGYDIANVLHSAGIPRCTCGGIIKPDVVLYEEGLDTQVLESAATAIAHADMLIIGGTSLGVYPAAGLVRFYQSRYNKLVLINRDETPLDARADLVIHKKIGEVLAACRDVFD